GGGGFLSPALPPLRYKFHATGSACETARLRAPGGAPLPCGCHPSQVLPVCRASLQPPGCYRRDNITMTPSQRLWASKSRECARSGGSMAWSTERLSFRFGVVYQCRGWPSCIHGDERRRVPVLNSIDTPPTTCLQVSASSLYDQAALGSHKPPYQILRASWHCEQRHRSGHQ